MVVIAVRRERVVLELQDDLSTGMVKAAAATALLDKELNHLSGQSVATSRSTQNVDRDVDHMGSTLRKSGSDIDKYSGRLGLLLNAGLALGPAFEPVGAVAVPAVTGLAASFGFAATGAAVAVLAFRGVGDALKAVNKAALEPTETNLENARVAMDKISPSARQFVRELQSMEPELNRLKSIAATGLFPGLTEGIDGLLAAAPRVERLVSAIATELGAIGAEAGKSLGSDRWAGFLDFLGTEGPAALAEMAKAAGNTAHALAGLWMATTPLNEGFLNTVVKATGEFDKWANSLQDTQGFENFVAYIQETGPQLAETVGAIGNAFVQVAQAAAPLGGPTLRIIEVLANAVAKIADSPLGTPLVALVTTMATLRLATQAYGAVQARTFGAPAIGQVRGYAAALTTVTTAQDRARLSASELAAVEGKRATIVSKGNVAFGKNIALVAGLTAVSSGLTDKLGLTNTASLAMAGSLAGPWGAAIGAGIGLVDDLTQSFQHLSDAQTASYVRTVTSGAGSDLQKQLDAVNAAIATQKDASNAAGPDFTIGNTHIAPFDFGSGWKHADDKLTALKTKQAELTKELNDGRDAAIADFQAIGGLGDASQKSTADLAKMTKAANDNAQAAQTIADSFLKVGPSISDAKVSLRDWIHELKQQADALANFAKNSEAAAKKGLSGDALKFLQDQGAAGALRLKQLAGGGAKDIRAFNKVIAEGQRNTKLLNDALNTLGGVNVKPKVDVDVAKARAAIQAVRDELAALHDRNINVKVSTLHQATNDGQPHAAGGPIYGPGTATSDSIPAMLSDGEFVIRAAAVQKYGLGFFDAANQMRLASGGYPSGLGSYIRNDLDLKFPHTLHQWNEALKASTKLLDKETSKRQALLDLRSSTSSAIQSNYASDLFSQAPTSSIWMSNAERAKAGTGSVFSTLTGDIGNLESLKAAIARLKADGLNGAALSNLLSNGSLAEVQAFANGPKSDVTRYESLFNRRQSLLTATGNQAAVAVVSQKQLTAATEQLAQAKKFNAALTRVETLLKRNPHATGHEVAKAINGAIPKRGR